MSCTESDFDYLRRLVRSEASIVLDPGKTAQFEMRLGPIAREAGTEGLEQFVELLRSRGTTPLRRAVAEAMTTNETSFFRDAGPFNAMRDLILPELIRRNAPARRLRIWSAAASTGQEAYSVAMLLWECFPEVASTWDVKIVGTDISQCVIEYARAARYRRLEVNRGLPARLLLKYMVRDEDEWEVAQPVRSLCEFHPMNLCAPASGGSQYDLILLRNVLLYFSQADRARVFGMIHRQVVPEGYLILGGAEQAEDSTDLFKAEFARDCYFYRPVSVS